MLYTLRVDILSLSTTSSFVTLQKVAFSSTCISIHSKVSTYLDRTPIFEWWVVRCTSKNGHQKDMCSTLKRTNQAKVACRCIWSNLRGIEQVFLELRFFPLVAIEVPNHLVNWFVKIYYQHFSLVFEAPQAPKKILITKFVIDISCHSLSYDRTQGNIFDIQNIYHIILMIYRFVIILGKKMIMNF